MARRRKRRFSGKCANGTVYVIEIEMDGVIVHKVGATKGSARKRVLQILEGVEREYEYFPKCTVVAERMCANYYQMESKIHRELSEYSYTSKHSFCGSSELFKLELDILLEVYNGVIDSDDEVEDDGRINVC